jgi:hypothetical protein
MWNKEFKIIAKFEKIEEKIEKKIEKKNKVQKLKRRRKFSI